MTVKATGKLTGLWRMAPNALTLLRVLLTCFVHYYLLTHFGRIAIPLVVTGLIFLTDYLDGKVARKEGTVTPSGALFDLVADFFYMLPAYLVLQSFHLIPFWFILLVLSKFIEYILTSFWQWKTGRSSVAFSSDCLGRFVAGLFYLLPLLLYIAYCLLPVVYSFCLNILIYIVLFLSLLSSVFRIRACSAEDEN